MSFVDGLLVVAIIAGLIALFLGTIYSFVEGYHWIAAIGLTILLVLAAFVISEVVDAGAELPCSEFANTRVQNVPARCAAEYGITR